MNVLNGHSSKETLISIKGGIAMPLRINKGKGKKDRYTVLSKSVLERVTKIFQEVPT